MQIKVSPSLFLAVSISVSWLGSFMACLLVCVISYSTLCLPCFIVHLIKLYISNIFCAACLHLSFLSKKSLTALTA